MKKTAALLITIIFAMALVVALPTGASAAVSASDVIYLTNPVSVAAADNKLFVADNYTEGQSLLHVFDVSGAPALKESITISEEIKKLKVYDGELYVITQDKITQYDISGESPAAGTVTPAPGITDMAITTTSDNKQMFFATADGKIRNPNIPGDISSGTMGSICEAVNNVLYCLYEENGKPVYKRYTMPSWDTDPTDAPEGSKDLLIVEDTVSFLGDTFIKLGTSTQIITTDAENAFVAACSEGNDVYAIRNKTVSKWTKVEGSYTLQEDFAIGSDTVELDVPDVKTATNFTLVSAKGYPASIIYKTNGEDSIADIIDNGEGKKFVILSFAEEPDYYYVFVDDKFGWVKKSADTIAADPHLQIEDNAVSGQYASYKAKLTSANAVYIYSVPCSEQYRTSFAKTTFNQTAANQTEVELLQSYTAADGLMWYYVRYEKDGQFQTGFVPQSEVGTIKAESTGGSGTQVPLDPQNPHMKINATLFSGVSMYLSENMTENELLYGEDKNGSLIPIRLETGTLVNVIRRTDAASYVQTVNADGTFYYGWVANDRLISPDALTTNAAVGLTCICVGVVIAIAALIIFTRRNKKQKDTVEVPVDE